MRTVSQRMRVAGMLRAALGVAVVPAAVAALLSLEIPEGDYFASVFQFFLAMTLLSLLDVLLPHGGRVDVDAPLVIASLYLFGPAITIVIVGVSRVLAHVLRDRMSNMHALVGGLVKRFAAIIVATGMMMTLSALPLPEFGSYIEVGGMGVVFIAVQLFVGQVDLVVERCDSLIRTVQGNLAMQGSVLAASVSTAVLTVVIHDGMGAWGLIVTLFLVTTMRQSFALLLDVRQSYQMTIETLMSAMEIQSPEEVGLGGRTARLARIAGSEYGWYGKRIENMGYAALLLHYGLAFRRIDRDSGDMIATPLADVEFLRTVEPIVGIVREEIDGQIQPHTDVVAAYLVSKAFGHVQGYILQATSRIGGELDSQARERADRAFMRALAKESIA